MTVQSVVESFFTFFSRSWFSLTTVHYIQACLWHWLAMTYVRVTHHYPELSGKKWLIIWPEAMTAFGWTAIFPLPSVRRWAMAMPISGSCPWTMPRNKLWWEYRPPWPRAGCRFCALQVSQSHFLFSFFFFFFLLLSVYLFVPFFLLLFSFCRLHSCICRHIANGLCMVTEAGQPPDTTQLGTTFLRHFTWRWCQLIPPSLFSMSVRCEGLNGSQNWTNGCHQTILCTEAPPTEQGEDERDGRQRRAHGGRKEASRQNVPDILLSITHWLCACVCVCVCACVCVCVQGSHGRWGLGYPRTWRLESTCRGTHARAHTVAHYPRANITSGLGALMPIIILRVCCGHRVVTRWACFLICVPHPIPPLFFTRRSVHRDWACVAESHTYSKFFANTFTLEYIWSVQEHFSLTMTLDPFQVWAPQKSF